MIWAGELFENIFTVDESCGCEECKDDYKEAEREGRPIEPIRARVILENDLVLAVLEKNKEIESEAESFKVLKSGLPFDKRLYELCVNEKQARAFRELVQECQKVKK